MKDNQKFTIGLLAVAVGLGTYMYFVESTKEVRPDTKDVEVWSLSESQAQDLKKLVVSNGTKTVTFLREGDKWKIQEMPGREVDSVNFKAPYDKLRDLMATRKLEDKLGDKAKYGLDKPTGSVTWGEANTPYKLTFGGVNPTADGIYTHVAKDDGVYVIAKYKVDEWKNLAATPPLIATPAPTKAPTAAPASPAASPAAASPGVASPSPAGAVTTPIPAKAPTTAPAASPVVKPSPAASAAASPAASPAH